jgi:hypothetical protein
MPRYATTKTARMSENSGTDGASIPMVSTTDATNGIAP